MPAIRKKSPLLGAWALVLVLLAGCAEIRSPSGGPLDKDTPYVQAVFPDSGAASISTSLDSLVIVFSERMNRKSVEAEFSTTPSLSYRERRWEDTRWILELREPLDSTTTYVGFLGAEAADRRSNKLGKPYTFVFATGDSIDDGTVEGKVIGRRFSPQNQFVYLRKWSEGYPDTTQSSYPDEPVRISQADAEGVFQFSYVPRSGEYRVCCFFDRDGDGQFQPLPDRWACLPESIVFPDSTNRVENVEIFLTDREETGTVSGAVTDSSCIKADAFGRLKFVRAERDSLLEWLESEQEARRRGRGGVSKADSTRVEREFADYLEREAFALEDSARCAQPFLIELVQRTATGADSVAQTQSGGNEFNWGDVVPGIYRLRAFRDLDGDGERGANEPEGQFQYPIEVLPLRVLDELDFEIQVDDAPADDVRAQDTPAVDVSADDAPADDAPADDVPADDAPADDVPADDVPADDVPAADTPAEDAPGNDGPGLATPDAALEEDG